MREPPSAFARLAGGRRLAYCEWGDAGGAPVVLLHGAPGSRLFRPEVVPAGMRLVTFDRPGFGRSDRREGRTLLDTPGDVAALADHLELARFAIVGVSAGGPHALACACALGERVTSVGVASMPGPLDEVPGAWDALPKHVRPAAERARVDPAAAVRGVVRYMEPWVGEPAAFLRGGTAADRALIAEPESAAMLGADVIEALRPGAAGFGDDMVTLWRPWGFAVADVPAGVRIGYGAHDTRAAPDFEYLAGTSPTHVRPSGPTRGTTASSATCGPSSISACNPLNFSVTLGNSQARLAVPQAKQPTLATEVGMMLMRYDPFRELDRFTDGLFGNAARAPWMPMDAVRYDDRVEVHFDLPGVRQDSIELTVERNVLTVKAERHWLPEQGAEVLTRERTQGSFSRQVLLSEALAADRVDARYDQGVLTVTIPIAERAKPRKVEIHSGEAQPLEVSASS